MRSVPEIKQQIILLAFLIHALGYTVLSHFDIINENTNSVNIIAFILSLYICYKALKYNVFGYLVKNIKGYIGV